MSAVLLHSRISCLDPPTNRATALSRSPIVRTRSCPKRRVSHRLPATRLDRPPTSGGVRAKIVAPPNSPRSWKKVSTCSTLIDLPARAGGRKVCLKFSQLNQLRGTNHPMRWAIRNEYQPGSEEGLHKWAATAFKQCVLLLPCPPSLFGMRRMGSVCHEGETDIPFSFGIALFISSISMSCPGRIPRAVADGPTRGKPSVSRFMIRNTVGALPSRGISYEYHNKRNGDCFKAHHV